MKLFSTIRVHKRFYDDDAAFGRIIRSQVGRMVTPHQPERFYVSVEVGSKDENEMFQVCINVKRKGPSDPSKTFEPYFKN